MKKILLMSVALGWSVLSAMGGGRDDARIDSLVNNLLSRMTIEEKIGQLNQRSGFGYAPEMVELVRSGKVGSLLNEVDPETVNKLQHEAVENSRLGIPLIFARDVIHGFKTIFPIPLGQAAMWDAALVEEGARIASDEASSVGVRWTFSPMVDIARDPRWGRIAEGFGEDTWLASQLGAAMVRGYQGEDLSKPNTMAACVKHFAGYGAAEGGRDYNTTWIPEIQLRETYLPPFKAAADAGAATFMCSFNDINGVPSSANSHLMRDILRDEWGFDGVVVSDWGSIEQMRNHGYSADLRQAAAQGANAGVDVDMENYAYLPYLKELVESGEVSEATLDEMVANVLRLKYRLGLFDNPYIDLANAARFYQPASLEAARKAAEEGALLLTNNGVLPLSSSGAKKIAVIGPMADAAHDQAGTWCFDLEKEHCVTPLKALRDMYGEDNIVYVQGLKHTRDLSTAGFEAALKAAKKADIILFFGGEEAVLSGEAHCRTDLTLPGAQTALIKELKKTGKPVVVVVQAGRSMALAEPAQDADALVFMFHGGTMAGPALANLLSGKTNFSGRTPVSFPRTSGQVPIYYNRKNTGRPAADMVLIQDIPMEAGQTSTGCTSFYLDAGDGALFPFGYGLSYTTFNYSEPELSTTTIGKDGSLTASCTVTNTGDCEGSEVAQLYIRDNVASRVRPVRELRGFKKISLKPGESKEITFNITPEELAYYVNDTTRAVEPGTFTVWIAPNSISGTPVVFEVVETDAPVAAK